YMQAPEDRRRGAGMKSLLPLLWPIGAMAQAPPYPPPKLLGAAKIESPYLPTGLRSAVWLRVCMRSGIRLKWRAW
ncbi:MAG TPA: hypothetical protein VFC21_12980, partial [Bryobacteraceae bacterium]|nr:hypothetical protein [Bryobacteraceae bacterium]